MTLWGEVEPFSDGFKPRHHLYAQDLQFKRVRALPMTISHALGFDRSSYP